MLGETLLVQILNCLSRRPSSRSRREGLLLGDAHDVRGMPYRVRMSAASRTEHAFVLGKTGTGKTHLLQHLAEEHMRRHEGFVLFDFHGDCVTDLVHIATQYADASDQLVIIDPTDPHVSPGLNPLALRTDDATESFRRAADLAAILRARWNVDAFGPRSEELLRNVLYTLAANGLTLVEAPLLLTSAAFRARLVRNLPSADIVAYWRDRFEPLSDPMKAMLREPLLNKMTGFLVEPSTRHLLGQSGRNIDFGSAMQRGAWVLINLSKGVLGDHAHTLANLIFAVLQNDVFARTRLPRAQRRLFTILVDEVQNLAENDLITLLTEGRKFGVGLITANQYWDQLPKPLRGALLATGTQIFFRVSHADASALAVELAANRRQHYTELLTTLPRGHAVARLGTAAPEVVSVPAGTARTRRTEHAAYVLRALSLHRYARRREDIEQDIRARGMTPRAHEPVLKEPTHAEHEEGQHDW